MDKLLSRNSCRMLLVIIGLTWIFALNYVLKPAEIPIYPDSGNYLEAAQNLYFHLKPHEYRPILMAAISGFPYLFGAGQETTFTFSRILNCILWLGTTQLLFSILISRLNPIKAFLGSLCFVLSAGSAILVFYLLTESLFTFLLLLSFYWLNKYHQNQKYVFLSATVCVFLLLGLIKPGAIVIGIFIVIYFLKTIAKFWRSAKSIPLYFAFGAIILQCSMMRATFGNFTVSYIDAVTYYNYLGSRAESNDQENFIQDNARNSFIFSAAHQQQKQIAKDDFIRQIQVHPLKLITAYVLDFKDNSVSGSNFLYDCMLNATTGVSKNFAHVLFLASKLQNALFSFLGLLTAAFWLYKRSSPLMNLMAVYVIYVFATSAISFTQGDRFHIVLIPIVIILSAFGFIKSQTIPKDI